MRTVAYVRELPSAGPDAAGQRRAFLDHCAACGLEPGEVFAEAAPQSGPDPAPAFLRMVDAIDPATAEPSTVVIERLAVLGHTARDQLERYYQLRALPVPLHIATLRADCGREGNALEGTLIGAWERRGSTERRRERVREGMRRAALRGEVLGRAPFGYRVLDHHLAPEAGEAAAVSEMFRLAVEEDLGVRLITRRLNDHGFRTRRGRPWGMVSVRNVLRNPVYTGTSRRLGVMVPNAHPAIVPGSRFREAQQRLDARRTTTVGGPGTRAGRRRQYLLAGLVSCGVCGRRMTGDRGGSGSHGTSEAPSGAGREQARPDGRYRCGSSADACTEWGAGQLEAEVFRQFAGHASAPASLGAATPGTLTGVPEDGPAGVHRLVARRTAHRRELDRLLERRSSGELTPQQFRERATSVAVEDLRAERALHAAQARAAGGSADGDNGTGPSGIGPDGATAPAERWQALPLAERRRLLRATVRAIVVTDREVRVEFAP